MKYENVMEIDLGRCMRALLRKWKFIVLMAVIFGVAGLGLTLQKQEDQYAATSSVYSVSSESYNFSQQGVSAMNDYVDIVTSMKVCKRAALLLGDVDITGESVMEATTVFCGEEVSDPYLKEDSGVIWITSTTSDPVLSMEMAQAVADAFIMEMEIILGTDSVRVLDNPYAYRQTFDATQQQWMIRILLVVFGIVIAVGIIVMKEIFDVKASTIRECSLGEELPIIGVIPRYKD